MRSLSSLEVSVEDNQKQEKEGMESNFSVAGKLGAFFSPNKIIFGVGAAKQVGAEAKSLGGKKVLIVTDQGVAKAGLVEIIKESLWSEKIRVDVFDKVEIEPPARVVDKCAQLLREEGYNLIIGLGGGSSLDTAKGAAIMATNRGKVLDYAGVDLIHKRGLPKILLPTTAGSGSEVTRIFAVTDEVDKTKKPVYSNFGLADVAILDPLLTVSMPPLVTATTGIDALAHAIESYVSVNATPLSDILSIEAIRLVSESLPPTYAKRDKIGARFNMIIAAALAGLAWQSGGLGAVHGLSYILETEYHMAHGTATAIMLPHVMDYNKIGNLKKYAKIAQAMGENIEGLSDYEAAEKSIGVVERLLENVEISTSLTDHGVPKEGLPKLVEGGMKQARLFVPNPRDLAEEDVRNIYSRALEGGSSM